MVIKSPKAASAAECLSLEQLPNVGPAIAADLRLIGIERPADLRDKDPWNLYRALCEKTGVRQDPCVLDTLMAAAGHRMRPVYSGPATLAVTTTPTPASSICSMAQCSCCPQSQRREPKVSPVRHLECIRTRTFSFPATSPCTNATCSASSTALR